MKKHRMASLFLALLLAILMAVPAYADGGTINGEVTITRAYGIGETYSTYTRMSDADNNPIVVYADRYSFPIEVSISPYEPFCGASEREINTYGTHRVQWRNLLGVATYATIIVEPYPTQPQEPKEPTQDEIIDDKLDRLLKELKLGFINDEMTPYGKELRAFIAGEWDGRSEEHTSELQSPR